jgi:hypothetical protein
MGVLDLERDAERNRLYVEFAGEFDPAEAAAADRVVDAADDLEPGFAVVTDSSGFLPSDGEAVQSVARAKAALVERGCAIAVRIVPDNPTAKLQYEEAGAEHEQYLLFSAPDREAAQRLLAEKGY